MKKVVPFFLSLFLLFPLYSWGVDASYVLKERWDSDNNPSHLGFVLLKKFSFLPLAKSVARYPWSDSYWPSREGGIALRWNNESVENASDNTPFHYQTYSREQVERMTPQERAKLSPAEKYDLYMGRYDYPTVQRELSRTKESDPQWFGLCHGWAAASINFSTEPQPVVMKSVDGLEIPFGSSDIKAMLTYYQGEMTTSRTRFLGKRCEANLSENPSSEDLASCRDTNAGAFHIILTNYIGLWKQAFIADMTRDEQVWNQPLAGYRSTVIGRTRGALAGAAAGTVEEVELRTEVDYVVESAAEWDKVEPIIETKTFEYRLELNSYGNIIGGEWLSYDRPDFLWSQKKPRFSHPYYGKIKDIYKSSVGWLVSLLNFPL